MKNTPSEKLIISDADIRHETMRDGAVQLLSDTGFYDRTNGGRNEDAASALILPDTVAISVADGAGSHPRGNEVSKLAVASFARLLEVGGFDMNNIMGIVRSRIINNRLANITEETVVRKGIEKVLSGSPTTTLAWAVAKRNGSCVDLTYNRIGDSRVIIIDPSFTQIIDETIDQTYPNDCRLQEGMSDDELKEYQNSVAYLTHELNHAIVAFLSQDYSGNIEQENKEIRDIPEGSVVLVVSDLITSNFTTEEMLGVYREFGVEKAPEVLMAMARQKPLMDKKGYEVVIDGKKVRVDKQASVDNGTIAQMVIDSRLFS